MVLVAISSATFSGNYLRMDGEGVTEFTGSGGGNVRTQVYVGTYETFTMEENTDGTVSFRSTVHNSIYLRLDGANVTAGSTVAGGVVNCQFSSRPYEKFIIRRKTVPAGTYSGIVGIESAAFPGRFLRLTGNGGEFNVQGSMTSNEEFYILVLANV